MKETRFKGKTLKELTSEVNALGIPGEIVSEVEQGDFGRQYWFYLIDTAGSPTFWGGYGFGARVGSGCLTKDLRHEDGFTHEGMVLQFLTQCYILDLEGKPHPPVTKRHFEIIGRDLEEFERTAESYVLEYLNDEEFSEFMEFVKSEWQNT